MAWGRAPWRFAVGRMNKPTNADIVVRVTRLPRSPNNRAPETAAFATCPVQQIRHCPVIHDQAVAEERAHGDRRPGEQPEQEAGAPAQAAGEDHIQKNAERRVGDAEESRTGLASSWQPPSSSWQIWDP